MGLDENGVLFVEIFVAVNTLFVDNDQPLLPPAPNRRFFVDPPEDVAVIGDILGNAWKRRRLALV